MKVINTTNKLYLRYGNFTKNPAPILEFLGKQLDCRIHYSLENENVSINLKPGHVFTGNRSRNDSGKISIREDLKWKNELNMVSKIIVSIFSLPLFNYILTKYRLKYWHI